MMIPLPLAVSEPLPRIRDVFCAGNEKVGSNVLTFSLPVILSCPGKSNECVRHCYAKRPGTRISTKNCNTRYRRNWRLSMRPDFVEIVNRVLRRTKSNRLVRLHVSGDFYDAEYARKWLQIVSHNPHCTFWTYTRSWTRPEIREVLFQLAECENCFLWFSLDRSMRRLRKVPPRVRWAYMMVEDNDVGTDVDLYFRTHALRKDRIVKRVAGTLVCPAENGITHTTCEKCRLCFTLRPTRRNHVTRLPLR